MSSMINEPKINYIVNQEVKITAEEHKKTQQKNQTDDKCIF